MTLEKMDEFFTARVDNYDEHMLSDVPGCREGYKIMAGLIPENTEYLLDLGCGTGLELNEIFKKKPAVCVTGVDLTKAMLDKLKEKYPGKNLKLVNASYFDYDFGQKAFDACISFQTMHHFTHDEKIKLYRKIFNSLKPGGVYIECDYMVENQSDEDFYYSENSRIRIEQGIKDDEFYHYDTPCTIKNQIEMLLNSGFPKVEKVWRLENTTILTAHT
ncbi:MAG: class I SAM-dependent methyltransferase [Bacillota bacterium]|nr:class I SAM-dependent methyltransferase [Bacillota bacterium]